jgi:cobalt-zinc-cadmium efflux system membrane fusion protein
MNLRSLLIVVAGFAAIGTLGAAAWLTRDHWEPWIGTENGAAPVKKEESEHHDHSGGERVKLSPQAQANLRLVVKPVQPQTFLRNLQLPATIVERRGKGDRGVTAPVAGIIQTISVQNGDTVRPEDVLLTLRINSEGLQASQTELYKTAQEIQITEDQRRRLEKLAGTAVPQSRLTDLQYQLDRLNASRKAYRADLTVKGLSIEQLDQVEQGQFLKDISVPVAGVGRKTETANSAPLLEIEELKIQRGEQVQAGQLLATLANHQNLFIEGRGFREDTPLLEKAVAQGWPVSASFLEEMESSWPASEQQLKILYLANAIDPSSQTFPFFVPVSNQFREYTQDQKTYRIWRFRPGQRVQLGVPVEAFENVFILPVGAVVREAAEAYVFRQNGEAFDRKPVHVVYEDARHVAIANDGSIFPGSYIAHNGAEVLNRALKAQAEGGGGHDAHAGHNH